jgi:hypothetical protein
MSPLLRVAPAAFLSALLLWSCAPRTPGVVLDPAATPAAELRRLVSQKEAKLRSLEGSGAMSFDTPEMSGDAAFTTRLKRPDSLLVLLEGPFGIDIGTLFLSRERYVVYNSLENRVVTGNPSSGSFRSVIPFELTYDQVLSAFAGIVLLPGGEPERYEVRDGRFYLAFPCKASTCEYWIDPDLLMVTRFRTVAADGSVLMEVDCSSPFEEDDAAASRRIRVAFPGEQRRLSIAYSRVTLNEPDLSFDFSIPKNAHTSVR